MYKFELAFAALRQSELQRVSGREERTKIVEEWMRELGLKVGEAIKQNWGAVWNIQPDQVADFENALLPMVEKMAPKGDLQRLRARILMVEGPTEMHYHEGRYEAVRVMDGPVALYEPLVDGIKGVPAPEKYVTGQHVYINPFDRHAWMPLPDGKNGYGLPKTVILAELWLARKGVESLDDDMVVTIDPYENFKH